MSDKVVEPQATALAAREDYLRKWKVNYVNGIGDINTNSTITLYTDIARNVIKCDISGGKTPGSSAYCKTSGCEANWENADFAFANGVVTGVVGGQSGSFNISNNKPPRSIEWSFGGTSRDRTPAGPGSSWSGTED